MSSKDSKVLKAATHREAIQRAAVINNPGVKSTKPAPARGTNSQIRASGGLTASSSDETASSINFTVGVAGDPINEDYEGNKVSKSKRNQNEADIKMVADLDRWG